MILSDIIILICLCHYTTGCMRQISTSVNRGRQYVVRTRSVVTPKARTRAEIFSLAELATNSAQMVRAVKVNDWYHVRIYQFIRRKSTFILTVNFWYHSMHSVTVLVLQWVYPLPLGSNPIRNDWEGALSWAFILLVALNGWRCNLRGHLVRVLRDRGWVVYAGSRWQNNYEKLLDDLCKTVVKLITCMLQLRLRNIIL